MYVRHFFLLLISLGLCISTLNTCANEKSKEAVDDKTIKTNSNKVVEEVDSAYLEKLEESFENGSFLYNYIDSADQGFFESSFVECKLDVNGDGIEDFFVLSNDFHHVQGTFYNGLTGNPLNQKTDWSNNMFWNRPYPNENNEGVIVSIVDVDCGDDQKDLQVIFQSGPPPGSIDYGVYLEIYHFNTDSNFVELIFSEQLAHEWDPDNLDTVLDLKYEFYYTNLLTDSIPCLDKINIQEGTSPADNNVFNYMDIRPKKQGLIKKFIYNKEKQTFVEQK